MKIESAIVLVTATLVASSAFAEPASGRQVSSNREGNCEAPIWSRDGRSLAWERIFYEDRKIELDVIRNAHDKKPKETQLKPQNAKGNELSAAFKDDDSVKPGDVCRELAWGPVESPSAYVFSCNESRGGYQLFMTEGEQLTRGRHAAGQPALTQSSWRLAFVGAAKGREGLFVIHDLLEEIKPVRLLTPSDRVDRVPVWSPNGKTLAFVGHDRRSADIYMIENVRNPKQTMTRLTKWPSEELNPSFSPDGSKLAFFSDYASPKKGKSKRKRIQRRGGQSIYVVDLKNGGEPYLVVKNVVANERRGPAWTPDGKWLVYVKDYQKGVVVDPIRAAKPVPKATEVKLKTGTVSNKDPDIAAFEGRWYLTYSAIGRIKDGAKRTWRKIYVSSLDRLQKGSE